MANNLLVDWLNNKKKNVQTNVLRKSATNTNNVTTPNLPIKPTTVSQTGLNLQKVQQPVQTRLNTVNSQTAPVGIQSNNPAFNNGALVNQNNQPSRFIGFQQQPQVANTTISKTANEVQGKNFGKVKNGYGYIASDVNKAESANRKEEQRYRNMSEAFYDLQGTLYNRGKALSENEIRQKFPEFKDLDMNVLNDLQNELLPIVSSGMGVDADQISQIYPELLKGKELKDIEKVRNESNIGNSNYKALEKRVDKALKSNWAGYSANGIKYLQDANTLFKAVKQAKQQGIVGGANDIEILKEIARTNPELQNAIREMNTLELSEKDKAKLGKKDTNLFMAISAETANFIRDVAGLNSDFQATDEELTTGYNAKKALEDDYWGETRENVKTKANVPINSIKKRGQRTANDLGGQIFDKMMENMVGDKIGGDVGETINEASQKFFGDIRQKVIEDYQNKVNANYKALEEKNLNPDIESFYGNRSMTRSLLQGDLRGFGYKAAGDTAQNWEMPVVIATSVIQPEVGFALMAGDSYVRENQESFEELREAGATYEQAQEGAAIVGLASSAVELTLEKLLGGVETTASRAIKDIFMKDFSKKAADMVAQRGLVDILKQGAVTQFRSSFEEGLEEIVQQAIHNRAIQQYDPNQEITEGLVQAFEGGFFNPMNLLAGGGDIASNVDTNSIKQGVNNAVDNATTRARDIVGNVQQSVNNGVNNVRDFMNRKNKVTSQGGTNNTQQQGQQTQLNTASENQNNINGENNTENGGWSQPKKGVVGTVVGGIGKAYDATVGKVINTVAEKGAEVITDTSSPQDKLFQAVNPSLNRLTNKRGNYEQKRKNADRTNELIIEYGYKPENSADYYSSLIKTKNALWKNEIQRGLDAHKYTTVKSTELTNAVRDAMQEDAKFPLETNKSDLNKLNKELKRLDKEGELTLEQLESLKQQINQKLNYGKNAEAGEIYEKGLRAMNSKISEIEDQLIAKLPGEFTKFKKDYGALKDMEDDVLKMMLKDMKKKDGGGLTQNMGRLAGVGKLLSSPLEGTMQIIFGETIGKAKETNFLIQKGFEDLRNQYKGEKKTLDVKDKPAEKVLALPDGIKLTKVTEIDARKPKNKVTKKNNKSDNNKKSDSSSSDDGGTPTGGTPTGTNPTNNQGGTTDDTKNAVTKKKTEATAPKTKNKTVDISNVKNISDLRNNLENKEVGDHRVDYGYINGKYYEIEEFVGEYHIVEGDKPSDINHAKNGVAIGGQYVNTINGLKAFIEGKSNGEVIKADRTEETAPKQEENQTKKFTYDEYGEVMNKIGEVEKKINKKLDKQYEQERAEKMSRFEELRDKEDKTETEGKELVKLQGELNNMSNKYDKLKEDELKKQAPELLQQKEELQQAFDRDWKAAMDKKMEEMEKPFNDLRDEFRQKLRDELGIADDVILDEKYYNSLAPKQKETADRINKEFADKYDELRKRAVGEEIVPEIKKTVEKKQEKPKKKQTKKEEKEARARGLAKPDGNLIYSSGDRKYVPSLKEGLIRLTKEEGQKKFKEQLGNAFRGGLEITVREDNESPYYDADRFFIYNSDREGIEEWEDRDIEELTINGDNIKEFEVSNDGDVDIIIDDPYIEGKDREIILDLKDFLNYSNMTRYIGKEHPRNLLGGSKNKVTSSAPIDTFEDLDFWTIKELKDRGDQAAIDLYEEMGIEDDALEELYKEMLIEENETPQRPSIFDEELETERQLSENETAQTPTIFEEDLEQMNLRELDENETPQINEEEIENSINSKKEAVTPEYQEILDKMPDDGRNYFIYIKVGDKYYIEGNPKGRMVYATMYKKENVAKMLPKLDEHIEAGSDYQIRDYNGNVYYQSTGTWQKSEEQLAKERAEDEAKAEAQKPAYERDEKYSQIKDFIEGIDNKAQKTKAANKLLERTRWQLDDGKIVNRTKAEFLEYLVKEQGKTPKEFPTGKTYPNGEPKVEYMIVNDKNIGYKSSKIENDYARSLLETPEEQISKEDEEKLKKELFTSKTTTEVTGEKNAVTAKQAENEKPKNLVTSRIENTNQEIQEIDKDTYFDDIVKNLKDHPREMFIYKDGSYFYPHYILPSGKVLTPENTYWGEVSSEEAARNWLLKEAEEHTEENETKKAEKLKEIVGKTAEKYEATLKRIESDNPMQEIWTSGDYFKYGMGNNQMARAKKESEANAEVGTFKKDVIDGKEGYRIFVAGTKNEAIRAFYEPKTGKTYRIYRGPIIDDSKPYTTKQVERIEKFLQNVDKQLDKETKKEKKEEKQVITQERLDSLKPDKDGIIELDYKGDERWALGKGKEALIKEGKADGKYLYNYGGAAHPQYMALYIKNGIVYEGRKGLEDQYMTTKQEAVDWLNQKEKDVEHESTERYTQTDYETLPKTISVESEAEKAGPKRIAPDRVKRQQETYDQGLESVKNVLKQSPVKIYELGFKSDRSKAVQDILAERRRIRELPESEAEKQWNELAKSVYEDLVIKDISKGYRYPEDVTSKFPKAQMKKAVDARARYEKGLFTSFSAKDTRANNQYRDEIGAGIKSQDGKPVTQEQMNEIVDGIRAYSEIFGIDMKKFAEDNNIIYVHLHGGNPFLMGGMNIGGLYRRDAAGNISVSLGGKEGVMEKGEDGEMKKTDIKTTTTHEITHAVDGMLDGKLFSNADIEILKKTMNKPKKLINYYNRPHEIVARAVEQYAAHKIGKTYYRRIIKNIDMDKGSVELGEKEYNYVDRQAYWDQENFDKYVKPIVEKNMKEKMKDYMIQQPKNNVIANDKNKITSK